MKNDLNFRMTNMIITDKHFELESLKSVLKNDLFNLFQNYFSLIPSDIEIVLKVNKDGEYELNVNLVSNRVKIFGSIVN